MCFRKNKEIETIDDCILMFKNRNFNIVNDRIEYTKKIVDLLNNLVQSAIEYGKNINNDSIVEQWNEDKITVADRDQYNLMLSMVKCQMEDVDGLFSFCTIRGFKQGDIPHFEFKDRRNFFL